MAKYKSPFSVNYRKPVILADNDPRSIFPNINKYRARVGKKVIIIAGKKPLKLQ